MCLVLVSCSDFEAILTRFSEVIRNSKTTHYLLLYYVLAQYPKRTTQTPALNLLMLNTLRCTETFFNRCFQSIKGKSSTLSSLLCVFKWLF